MPPAWPPVPGSRLLMSSGTLPPEWRLWLPVLPATMRSVIGPWGSASSTTWRWPLPPSVAASLGSLIGAPRDGGHPTSGGPGLEHVRHALAHRTKSLEQLSDRRGYPGEAGGVTTC